MRKAVPSLCTRTRLVCVKATKRACSRNIPAEMASAHEMTGICGRPISMLICTMIGSKMIDPTVCETNVVSVSTNRQSEIVMTHTLPEGRYMIIDWLKVFSSPDRDTASPRTLPPPIKNKICHENELKSNWLSMPVPNMTN